MRTAWIVALLTGLLPGPSDAPAEATDPATEIRTLLEENRIVEARALADRTAEANPEDAALQLLAGTVSLRADDEEAAERYLDAASSLSPDLLGLALRRGELEMRRCAREEPGRSRRRCFDRTREVLDRAVAADPDSIEAAAARTRSLLGAERHVSATRELERWAGLSPTDAEPRVLLAPLLAQAERWNDLAALPEGMADATPRAEARVLSAVASRLIVAGRLDQARPLVVRAIEREPDFARRAGLLAIQASLDSLPNDAFRHLVTFVKRVPDGFESRSILAAAGSLLVDAPADAFEDDWPCTFATVVDECGDQSEFPGEGNLPVLIQKAAPDMTSGIRRRRGGRAMLGVIVTSEGFAIPVRVLKSDYSAVATEAVRAIRQWRYAPATWRGRAVAIFYVVRVDFELRGPLDWP